MKGADERLCVEITWRPCGPDELGRGSNTPCAGALLRETPDSAELLEGGITNRNVRLRDRGRKYVVRLGADITEHRSCAGTNWPSAASHMRRACRRRWRVPNRACWFCAMSVPATLAATVDLVKTLHAEGSRRLAGRVLSFWVFHILRIYTGFMQARGSPYLSELQDLMEDADDLEARVGPVSLVLGHNDLLPANILRHADRLCLLTGEFGALNSSLFDIGGLATNAGCRARRKTRCSSAITGTRPMPSCARGMRR